MSVSTVQQLDVYGPDHCEPLSVEQARHMCRRLANDRYENFSVLSSVVPPDLRGDFAAVYAFCRWADDLGDEIGDRQRSLDLLAWWRRELEQCFAGQPRHPVFLALQPTLQRHHLPIEPFDDLIRAFEQDQSVDRYDTWEQLIGYCRLSANPVGRLVLMIGGEPRTDELFGLSDCICTALQLTNHWQDVRRDLVERDRIYIPREIVMLTQQAAGPPSWQGEHEGGQSGQMEASVACLAPATADFERRLSASARQGWGVDHEILESSRKVVRACVERTWPLFEAGAALLDRISPRTRPMVWLLSAGGQRMLHMIEMWNYETMLHRPKLGKATKLWLIANAWLAARRYRGSKGVTP
jgi:phytoene/squalene synthetase